MPAHTVAKPIAIYDTHGRSGLFTGAPSLDVQVTQFQCAYRPMPNPSWQFITPNLLSGAQVAQPAIFDSKGARTTR